MTNKTITLDRELVSRIVGLRPDYTCAQLDADEELVRAALADPVPPADEEPEVLQAVEDAMWGCFRDGVKEYRGCTRERVEETRSLIRAHVTRLQAEVEQWKDEYSNSSDMRLEEVAELLRVQSELTKARELLATEQAIKEQPGEDVLWQVLDAAVGVLTRRAAPHAWESEAFEAGRKIIMARREGLTATAPNQSAPADSQEIQKDRIKGMIATVGGEFAIMIDPANAHFGWTFKRHPDGMWVSGRKATEVEMYAARQHAKSTGQGV